jgi:hypothetical protein
VQGLIPARRQAGSISFSEGEGAVLKNEAQLLVLPHQQKKIVEQ